MIWNILVVITIILMGRMGYNEGYDFSECLFGAILYGILGGLLGFLLASVMQITCFVPVEEYTLESVQEIYTLKDNAYLSGGGFISVRIEEEDKYTYMAVNNDGTYSKKSIESDNVRIKEVDNVTPVLEKYIRPSKNQFWSIWSEHSYCFVVPKGTVINTYEIDLE